MLKPKLVPQNSKKKKKKIIRTLGLKNYHIENVCHNIIIDIKSLWIFEVQIQ
jgi:hypothetical protein